MILCAERFVIGGGRNVQHVLNPVIAIRNLQFVPVQPVVLEPTLPVQLEAQHINIKPILGGYVFNDESGVKYSHDRHEIVNYSLIPFDEGYWIAFWVEDLEVRVDRVLVICAYVIRDFAGGHAMRQQVSAQLRHVIGGETDFR